MLTYISEFIIYYNGKYYIIILRDHRRIRSPSLTETSLYGAYLYCYLTRRYSRREQVMKGKHMVTVAADRSFFLNRKTKRKKYIRDKISGPFLLTELSPKIIFALLNV